jgi:hypothetical protein
MRKTKTREHLSTSPSGQWKNRGDDDDDENSKKNKFMSATGLVQRSKRFLIFSFNFDKN